MLTEAPPRDYTIACQKMKPSEVNAAWDMLFHVLKKSELYDDAGIGRLLTDCMTPNGLQMWLLRGEMDGKHFPAGCMITGIGEEPYRGSKWLVLLHVNDVVHIDFEQWKLAYDQLFDYASERGAQWVEVYTENPRAKELLTAFGFSTAGYRKAV